MDIYRPCMKSLSRYGKYHEVHFQAEQLKSVDIIFGIPLLSIIGKSFPIRNNHLAKTLQLILNKVDVCIEINFLSFEKRPPTFFDCE